MSLAITESHRAFARECAHLFGGNGLSQNQQIELVAERAAARDAALLTNREAGCPHCRGEVGVVVCSVADAEGPKQRLASVRADLAALFALLDIEEDSELTGKLFHPNRITSCRALDGQKMNELLTRLKEFAASGRISA